MFDVKCRLSVCCAVLLAGIVMLGGFASSAAAAVTLGIHDGSINACNNSGNWVGSGTSKSAPAVNGPAAEQVLLNEAPDPSNGNSGWWGGLHSGTVRFSPPWDIALPDSGSASLITAHDPNSQWASLHLQTLKNTQACFDWWLHAAAQDGVAVQVAFKPDYDYRQATSGAGIPANAILAPSQSVYQTAITAFVNEYSLCDNGSNTGTGPNSGASECALLSGSAGPPTGGSGACATMPCGARVHIISPWGEPDFTSSGTAGNSLGTIGASPQRFYIPNGGNQLSDATCTGSGGTNTNWCGPVEGAQYYMSVLRACSNACDLTSGPAANQLNSGIVAGDFSSTDAPQTGQVNNPDGTHPSQPYWLTYAQHLNYCNGCVNAKPHTWGIHPYTDASDYEYCTGNSSNSYPPSGYYSKVHHFSDDLNTLASDGLLNSVATTSVWLNEISVYANSPYGPPGGCAANPSSSFSQRRQAFAFQFLVGANSSHNIEQQVPAGDPQIDRVYYLRAYGGDTHATYIDPGVYSGAAGCLYYAMSTLTVSSICT